MKTPRPIALFALLFGFGCAAASTTSVSRSYERPEVREVRLKTLEVVVVAAPIATSGPVLNVPTFEPPALDAPLGLPETDLVTEDALRAALSSWLGAEGFTLTAPASGGTGPVPLAPINTSTTVVGSASVALAKAGVASTPAPARPAPTETLGDRLRATQADAVLVVRVVPVDAFYVITGGPAGTVDLGDGTVAPRQADKPELRSGRLLVGQAFLFDRASRLRMWSRQLPDFPNGGILTSSHPFLGYGVVTDPAKDKELPVAERAERSASAFTKSILAGFPPARSDEVPEARRRLGEIDLVADATKEETLDSKDLGLELHLGYGVEGAGTGATLNGQALPDLGTGALAPVGVLRLGLGARYRAPGGLTFSAAGYYGKAPGTFARSLYQGGPDPNNPDSTSNRLARVTIEGVGSYGLEARVGYTLLLGPRLSLLGNAGVGFEVWSFDAAPAVVVPDDLHLRFGLVAGAELHYRLGEAGPWYLRGGPLLRFGLDAAGPAYVGAGLDVGLGVQL